MFTIQELLRHPSDFGFHDPEHPACSDPEHWALGPVFLTRDSGLLGQSNASALRRALADRPELAEDWQETRCGHWAVGWVDHLSLRVLGEDGQETAMLGFVREWFGALEDYPIADDEDFSEREAEALRDSVRQSGQRYVRDGADDDWVERVVARLEHTDPSQLESHDDHGPSPDDDAVLDALRHLELAETDDDDGDDE